MTVTNKKIEDIIEQLNTLKTNWSILEKNLYNIQLQFDFGELHGDTETTHKTNR